jgi:hypothetical protein
MRTLRTRRHAALLAALAAVVILGVVASPRARSAPQTPPSARPSLFVSANGSDSGSCTRSRPCASFDRAYTRAKPGAVVEVAGGGYPKQEIDSEPKAHGPNVIFQPAPGARVVAESLQVTRGSYIEFRDLTASTDTYNRPGAQHITYRRIHMRDFFVRGADHILYVDSDVGPNSDADEMNWITAAYESDDPPTDIVLDRVRIHDFKKHMDGSHVDCIGINDVDRLVIRNSRIWNCAHFAILFGDDDNSHRAVRNAILENNFIDCCDPSGGGYYSLGFGGVDGKVLIRFNSVDEGFGWLFDTGSVPNGLITVDSNIISNNNGANCERATWLYNVVARGTPCGGRRAATGFRSPPADLHLVGTAAARGAGNPKAFPARDIDGNPRLKGHRPDAGADQVR